jgi:hypothetical protein
MNGTVKLKLLGTLALGAALALAGAGCVEAPGQPADADEDVDSAVQLLDSIDSEGGAVDNADDGDADDDDDASPLADDDGGIVLQGDEDDGGIISGPEPVPWRGPDDDRETGPDLDLITQSSSSGPSNGHGTK